MRGAPSEGYAKGYPKNEHFTHSLSHTLCLSPSLSHTHILCVGQHRRDMPRAARKMTISHILSLTHSVSLPLSHTHTQIMRGTPSEGHAKGCPKNDHFTHSLSLTHSAQTRTLSLSLTHTHTLCVGQHWRDTARTVRKTTISHTVSLKHTLSPPLSHTHTQIMRGATTEGHGKGCPPGCGCNPSSNFSQGMYLMGLFYGSLLWVSFHTHRSLLMHKAVLVQISLTVCF